jgi:hypothetical protein
VIDSVEMDEEEEGAHRLADCSFARDNQEAEKPYEGLRTLRARFDY